MITFGPVPSRRLSCSLGINNIPPKFCSYSCIYCQVGSTPDKEIVPRPFYGPEEIRRAVEAQVEAVRELLARTGSPWDIIQGMIDAGKLRESEYEGKQFYNRRFPRGISPQD